jgi:hypothetical protein
LPGILAAKLGAEVTLTDLEVDRSGGVIEASPAGLEHQQRTEACDHPRPLTAPSVASGSPSSVGSSTSSAAAEPGVSAKLLENCKHCCALNRVHCAVVPLRWGFVTPGVAALPTPDLLIAADVMFDVAGRCSHQRMHPCVYRVHSCIYRVDQVFGERVPTN